MRRGTRNRPSTIERKNQHWIRHPLRRLRLRSSRGGTLEGGTPRNCCQRNLLAREAGALPRSVGAREIRPRHQPSHPHGIRRSHRAPLAANRELLALYWDIGRMILEPQKAEGWGTKVIDRLSRDLQNAFPRPAGLLPAQSEIRAGLSEAAPETLIVQQPVAQLAGSGKGIIQPPGAQTASARPHSCKHPSRNPLGQCPQLCVRQVHPQLCKRRLHNCRGISRSPCSTTNRGSASGMPPKPSNMAGREMFLRQGNRNRPLLHPSFTNPA